MYMQLKYGIHLVKEYGKISTKEDFYSILNEVHISDTQYVHAIKVWNTFKLKNI